MKVAALLARLWKRPDFLSLVRQGDEALLNRHNYYSIVLHRSASCAIVPTLVSLFWGPQILTLQQPRNAFIDLTKINEKSKKAPIPAGALP